MADKTGIEWTDATWNPTTGCDKISPGCDNCYALTQAARLKAMGSAKYQHDGNPITSGPGFGLTVHEAALTIPLRWTRPRCVFVNSMSDLGHAGVPHEFAARVWAVMAMAERHTFQVLTKRPERMRRFLQDDCACGKGHVPGIHLRSAMDWAGTRHSPTYVPGVVGHDVYHERAWPLPNVWVGTSIETDEYCRRADDLRETPAAVRFLSLEPLLGPLPSLSLKGIDWVIAGGESGPDARPAHPDWFRSIRDRCVAAGIPFFMKQWGEWEPIGPLYTAADESNIDEVDTAHMDAVALEVIDGKRVIELESSGYIPVGHQPADDRTWLMARTGKKAAGHLLDGQVWQQMPRRPPAPP